MDSDSELLWGLRGGGGNFGVVTELTFNLHPVGPIVFAGMMLWPRSEAARVGRAYRDYMASAPNEVGGGLAFIHGPPEPFIPEELQLKPAVGVIFLYVGPVEDGERAVAPLRELSPAVQLLAPMPYVGFQQLLDAGSPKGIHEYFRVEGLVGELARGQSTRKYSWIPWGSRRRAAAGSRHRASARAARRPATARGAGRRRARRPRPGRRRGRSRPPRA